MCEIKKKIPQWITNYTTRVACTYIRKRKSLKNSVISIANIPLMNQWWHQDLLFQKFLETISNLILNTMNPNHLYPFCLHLTSQSTTLEFKYYCGAKIIHSLFWTNSTFHMTETLICCDIAQKRHLILKKLQHRVEHLWDIIGTKKKDMLGGKVRFLFLILLKL